MTLLAGDKGLHSSEAKSNKFVTDKNNIWIFFIEYSHFPIHYSTLYPLVNIVIIVMKLVQRRTTY